MVWQRFLRLNDGLAVAVQVGSIVNFSLMYMLAKTPAQAMGAGSSNPLKALFDTNTLKRMGAPGVGQ